jgi:hypothetical protein
VELSLPDLITLTVPLGSSRGPGAITRHQTLGRRSGNVSILDFSGRYAFTERSIPVNRGPVGMLRFGTHPGFTRLSVNWLEGKSPESAEAEIACRDGEVAVAFRLTGETALASFPGAPARGAGADAPVPEPPAPIPPELPAGPESPAESLFPELGTGGEPRLPAAAPDTAPAPAVPGPGGTPLLRGEEETSGTASLPEGRPAAEPDDGKPRFAESGPALPDEPEGGGAPEPGTVPSAGPSPSPEAELPLPPPVLPASGEAPEGGKDNGGAEPGASEEPGLPDGPSAEAGASEEAGETGEEAPEAGEGEESGADGDDAPGDEGAGEGGGPARESGAVQGEPSDAEPAPYAACSGKGSGAGTFGAFSGSTDAEGRFVLELPFRGTVGTFRVLSQVGLSTGNVTFVDFRGNFTARVTDERLSGGPVGRVRIARHEGATRLSLNWRDASAPARVVSEVLCRRGGVAVRVAFEGAAGERDGGLR